MAGEVTSEREQGYSLGYSEPASRELLRRGVEEFAGFFVPHLRPGMRLLDVGSGPGTITLGLAKVVAPGEVIGIDIDAGQVEGARALATELEPAGLAPGTVRAAVRAVLGDPRYRAGVAALRAEIAALPSADEAVGWLEQVARERAPLTAGV